MKIPTLEVSSDMVGLKEGRILLLHNNTLETEYKFQSPGTVNSRVISCCLSSFMTLEKADSNSQLFNPNSYLSYGLLGLQPAFYLTQQSYPNIACEYTASPGIFGTKWIKYLYTYFQSWEASYRHFKKKKGFEPLGVSFPGRSDLGSLWWCIFLWSFHKKKRTREIHTDRTFCTLIILWFYLHLHSSWRSFFIL